MDKSLIAPKKIEDPYFLKQIEATKTTNGSAWNTAGTWEDKKLSMKFLQSSFEKQLIETEYKFTTGYLKVSSFDSVTGEASLVTSRGKRRMGYELELKVKLEGSAGSDYEGAEALIKIIELCDDLSEP